MWLESKAHDLVTLQLTPPSPLAPSQTPQREIRVHMPSPVSLELLPTQPWLEEQVLTFLIRLAHILPGQDAKEPWQQVKEVSSPTMKEMMI